MDSSSKNDISDAEIIKEVEKFLSDASRSYTSDDKANLVQMQQMGYSDECLNQLKLLVYKGDLNHAVNHYENDAFCVLYCVGDSDSKHGCNDNGDDMDDAKKCKKGNHTYTLRNLIQGKESQQDRKFGRILCLYLMYKGQIECTDTNNGNNNNEKEDGSLRDNASLYHWYAILLRKTGKKKSDFIKCEQFYLKALNIDRKYSSAHHNYAALLHRELKDFDNAELHYKLALDVHPLNKNNKANHDFGKFLIDKRKKYKAGLHYCKKACKLLPTDTIGHYWQGKALYYIALEMESKESNELHESHESKNESKDEDKDDTVYDAKASATDHFRLCVDELNKALKLHNINKKLKQKWEKDAKETLIIAQSKLKGTGGKDANVNNNNNNSSNEECDDWKAETASTTVSTNSGRSHGSIY